MRVMDGDLIIPTCLWTLTLILPTGHFMQMYYDPGRSGAVRLPIPGRQSGLYAALGEYQGIYCLEASVGFPPMCKSSLTNISIGRS